MCSGLFYTQVSIIDAGVSGCALLFAHAIGYGKVPAMLQSESDCRTKEMFQTDRLCISTKTKTRTIGYIWMYIFFSE